MKESLLKLAKLLAEDEKFLQGFSALKSVDEKYNFAQKSVKGYTKDEFIKFLDELEKSYETKKGVLPEDLEKVSGGASAKTKAAAMAMLALTAAGGISNLASAPLGASAMFGGGTTANVTPYVDFDRLFSCNEGQDLFDYSNSSKGGSLRQKILDELKSDKSGDFKRKIESYYLGASLFFKWIRSAGWIWTGWRFKFYEGQRKDLEKDVASGEYPEGEVFLWLIKKFEDENCWLYYTEDEKNEGKYELTLRKSSSITKIDYDEFKKDMDKVIRDLQINESSAPKAEDDEKCETEKDKNKPIEVIDKETFESVLKDVEHRLNQARAFRGACAKAGEMDVAETVMKTV